MAAIFCCMINACTIWRRSKATFRIMQRYSSKFNNDYAVDDFLKAPEPLIQKEFSRIMSLKDGTK